eukprot:7083349-Heterocapsa_arctica.AAC.1
MGSGLLYCRVYDVIQEWCSVATTTMFGENGRCVYVPRGCGPHDLGGWFVGRSAVVKWDGVDE